MVSSFTRSKGKLQRRALKDRPLKIKDRLKLQLQTLHETEPEMEISMASDLTHQPSTASPSHGPAAVTTTTAEDPVLDQFEQMKSLISRFIGAQQDSTLNP